MSDTFKVGEIAIYVRPGSPYYGQEVEIIGPLQYWAGGGKDYTTGGIAEEGYAYEINAVQGVKGRCCAPPEWLKKKKPPARDIDQKVSWDDCLWRPKEVTA